MSGADLGLGPGCRERGCWVFVIVLAALGHPGECHAMKDSEDDVLLVMVVPGRDPGLAQIFTTMLIGLCWNAPCFAA